jgi:hypothetical protein
VLRGTNDDDLNESLEIRDRLTSVKEKRGDAKSLTEADFLRAATFLQKKEDASSEEIYK